MLTNSKTDREYTKFREAGNGQTKVAVGLEGDTGLLEGVSYDDIQVTYPSSSTERYAYFLSSTLQATIEVTYSDSTKEVLTRVRRI
jgi:hypothetical protein